MEQGRGTRLAAVRVRRAGHDSGWIEVSLGHGRKKYMIAGGDESPADLAEKRRLIAWAVGKRLGLLCERGDVDFLGALLLSALMYSVAFGVYAFVF